MVQWDSREGILMNRDILIVLAFLGLWIVLNKWVLPWLGIPTCMSGGCPGSATCELPTSANATDEPLPGKTVPDHHDNPQSDAGSANSP